MGVKNKTRYSRLEQNDPALSLVINLGFTGFNLDLLGFTGFLLGFTGFLLGFTGFYWD